MVTTEEDINRIIGELRVAIPEHIQLTKQSWKLKPAPFHCWNPRLRKSIPAQFLPVLLDSCPGKPSGWVDRLTTRSAPVSLYGQCALKLQDVWYRTQQAGLAF